MARLLREGAILGGAAAESIHEILNEKDAIAFAMGTAKPGDLVVIFADDVTHVWKEVIYWGKDRQADKALG